MVLVTVVVFGPRIIFVASQQKTTVTGMSSRLKNDNNHRNEALAATILWTLKPSSCVRSKNNHGNKAPCGAPILEAVMTFTLFTPQE